MSFFLNPEGELDIFGDFFCKFRFETSEIYKFIYDRTKSNEIHSKIRAFLEQNTKRNLVLFERNTGQGLKPTPRAAGEITSRHQPVEFSSRSEDLMIVNLNTTSRRMEISAATTV